MAGIRIGGVTIITVCSPPWAGFGGAGTSGDPQVYVACTSDAAGEATAYTDFAGFADADECYNPVIYPDGTQVLFEVLSATTGFREIWVTDTTAGATPTQLVTDGSEYCFHPGWGPDSDTFVYVLGSGGALSAGSVYKDTVSAPGSPTLLKANSGSQGSFRPQFNFDGTRVAYLYAATGDPQLRCMDDDGTNESVIYTGTLLGANCAWSWDDTTIGFFDSVGDDRNYMVIQSDGTGQTTWETVDESTYGPSQQNPDLIFYTWTTNDEILTTVRAIADPDPDAKLGLIDSGGLTYVSPDEYSAADSGTDDQRPCAITGFLEGVERFFWYEDLTFSMVVSVLPDGSDKRTDFDGSGLTFLPQFQGFRGDTNS
jgi:Tol biopolymer transport system component